MIWSDIAALRDELRGALHDLEEVIREDCGLYTTEQSKARCKSIRALLGIPEPEPDEV